MGESGIQSVFTWGDNAIVSSSAPAKYRHGETVAICGLWLIEKQILAETLSADVGDVSYVIEYVDGSSDQIAEKYLQATHH